MPELSINPILLSNSKDLNHELDWFKKVLDTRLNLYFGNESAIKDIYEISPPENKNSSSNWARLLRELNAGFSERLAMVLALIPHIQPQLLDVFLVKNSGLDRIYTEFGGLTGGQHRGFIPTGETLLFILGSNNLEQRFITQQLLHPDHFLIKNRILRLEKTAPTESPLSGALMMYEEYVASLTHGLILKPHFGQDFPAELVQTTLGWNHLVLHESTLKQVEEIQTWIEHGHTLLNEWQMSGKIRPGLRALFYGPPGTGKTLTATLLGKATNRDVYRVDLSLVVSKYIGETEKNLSNVFSQAEKRDWILFFDEADALFGKRTETRSSHDRYANQEVAYLLQRLETFDGITILASNLKENLDQAFTRRFESIIYFPMPGSEERLSIWKNGVPAKARLAPEVKLEEIAGKHEMSGGAIMNAIRTASLAALKDGSGELSLPMILWGIRKEMEKEGRG